MSKFRYHYNRQKCPGQQLMTRRSGAIPIFGFGFQDPIPPGSYQAGVALSNTFWRSGYATSSQISCSILHMLSQGMRSPGWQETTS
jgi:hypothetical protein